MSNVRIDLVKQVPLNSSHLMAINEALGDIANYRQMIDVKINKINSIVQSTLTDNYKVVEEALEDDYYDDIKPKVKNENNKRNI